MHVPPIQDVDRAVFLRPPLRELDLALAGLVSRDLWPTLDELEHLRCAATAQDGVERPMLVAQDAALLADGLHYEERIRLGRLATRERNWHDLFNALVWLRWPRTKRALNLRQCGDIARIGKRQRTRGQCALTHFDEAGAIVLCSDPRLVELWDRHDWKNLFHAHAGAWGHSIQVHVFGHALLELALEPARYLVAKAVLLMTDDAADLTMDAETLSRIDQRLAQRIEAPSLLLDPQQLRPLPLSGLPGWHARGGEEDFFDAAPCFRPLRAGRLYPPADRF
ncbi:MAG: DUF3025 domain-containing protein [Gammaproteobacteria bacterium]|nr:MAG: DUF3025 domain-containing protein [Gammaproteobacteria bacterium]